VINWTIACDNCNRSWKTAGHYSIYARQAVESYPCPQCGAYTLCCKDPANAAGSAKAASMLLAKSRKRLKALAG
jgi:hypothetical protein